MTEEEILKFWGERRIFEKSLERPAGELAPSAVEEFIFYDGPPFATGLPHYGHILASAIKDTVPRYQTMRGRRVERRWGWDCHGLPIETIVEKELGLKSKNEIEKIGIDAFNQEARSKVLEYVGEWRKTVRRMARFVDFDGAYRTMDNSYIESVWWAIKEIEKKGLLYEGRRVLLYCPRCETPVSKAEVAMDNSYKEVTEEAITVKFKIQNSKFKDSYLLAWTTTPWTLPANVALAVNPLISYVKIKIDRDFFILAKERLGALKSGYEIVEEIRAEDLIGLNYEPLYELESIRKEGKRAWVVLPADFVTTEEGTGIVHTAVMYGEDDYNLGVARDLPQVPLLDNRGHFNKNAPEYIQGLYFKKAEKAIKEDLQERNLIFEKENNTHAYPHCWRCETALIYNAVSAWFVKIDPIKKRLLELNQKANWIPEHLKEGRFRKIVEGAPDWNISRNRYWASPLPIWKCLNCSRLEVVGSLEELKEKSVKNGNKYFSMRHGEAEANKERRISSRVDDPNHLTEKGRHDVREQAETLRDQEIDLIFASDFLRSKETAEIVASVIGLDPDKIVYDKRLREVDLGDLHGRPTSAYHALLPTLAEKFAKKPPGASEDLRGLKKRMGEFLHEIDAKYQAKKILIVSHEYPIWLLTAVTKGADVKFSIEMKKGMDEFINPGEIRNLSFTALPHDEEYELDYHRPYIDAIRLACPECQSKGGGVMTRVLEVVDCWIESAAMPFAAVHYPFEKRDWFRSHFPGDFVAEYLAQTRTWFYYSFVLAAILFDDLPFKNIVTTGTILAKDGSKMTKSKGNFPDPWLIFEKYGADALRFYLISSPVMKAEDLNFSEKGVDEVSKKLMARLSNVLNFYQLNKAAPERALNVLDKWMWVRLDETISLATAAMDRFELDLAARPILALVEDLSLWYIRRSRKSFSAKVARDLLFSLSKLLAPFTPFMAENIYQAVRKESDPESVHLEAWPSVNAKAQMTNDKFILEQMVETRKICSLGLEARAGAGIKVRQPLASLKAQSSKLKAQNSLEYQELIKDELNVKEIVFDPSIAGEIELDFEITPELKLEGEYRDLARLIQDKRKALKLDLRDPIKLILAEKYRPILNRFENELKTAVNASTVSINPAIVDTDIS